MGDRSRWEHRKAAVLCATKVRYDDEATAEREGLRIWRTRNKRPNPAMPYHCTLCDGYHLANRIPEPAWLFGSPRPEATDAD